MSTLPPLTPGPAQTTQADRLKFPGLVGREVAILKAWLTLHESEYTQFQYNVRVGKGDDPGPNYDQAIRDMAIANSQKRIDAVLWRGLQPYIIEVKERATPYIVGQLMSYTILWQRDNPTSLKPILIAVVAALDPDTVYCMAQLGITYNLVQVNLAGIKATKTT